jgi:hypothetical protein
MSTLKIENLSMIEQLDQEAMTAARGGFWSILKFRMLSLAEDQIGEECNDWICVPYQQED